MRKRRSGGTWFPTIGTAGPSGGDIEDEASGREFTVVVPNDGTTSILIAPIVPDAPLEGDDVPVNPAVGGQLAQILGQEYFIKRIVGKIFISNDSADDSASQPQYAALLTGAGFFVARANDSESGGGIDLPIGSASLAERLTNYNPLAADCIREPWIWRRTWVLGNPRALNPPNGNAGGSGPWRGTTGFFAAAQGVTGQVISSTMQYGSVLDGPHIDAKTRRRVRLDERLWFVVAARGLPIGSSRESVDGGVIQGYLDFRMFADIRKARNRGVF